MAETAGDIGYWSEEASVVAARLGTGLDGLTSTRAAAQLAIVGLNSVDDATGLDALRLFLRQFANPLVLILAFAAAISLGLQQWGMPGSSWRSSWEARCSASSRNTARRAR